MSNLSPTPNENGAALGDRAAHHVLLDVKI